MSAAGDVHAGVGTDAGGGAGSSSSHGGGGPHTAAEKLHAESYPLPDATYYAIEHPGYAATAEKLILTLGGMQRVQQAFAQERGYIDLNFCPSDPFMHSIAGDILPTANLLLRVVRRTNKRTGETTIEHRVAGVVSKTCRFRALADFQFETDPTDPIVQLRHQMQDLDVEAFRKPIFDTKTQGISDQLNQLPPPSFSRSEWPQEYKYTENPAVKLKLEGTDPAGRPIFRHVNESRVKRTQAPIFDPTAPSVPMHAPSWVSKKSALEPTLRELFEQRPVWTRIALINNIEIADYSTDMLKDALPMVAYFCATGAWRSTWVRYGFDPRADRSSRVFQTLDLRAVKQAQYTRAKRVLTKKDAAAATAIASTREPDPSERSRTSHIFDGQTYNALALFQMCDVTDPDMRNLIHSARYCRAEPDVRDGWYIEGHLEKIRMAVKTRINALIGRKFISQRKRERQRRFTTKIMDVDGPLSGDALATSRADMSGVESSAETRGRRSSGKGKSAASATSSAVAASRASELAAALGAPSDMDSTAAALAPGASSGEAMPDFLDQLWHDIKHAGKASQNMGLGIAPDEIFLEDDDGADDFYKIYEAEDDDGEADHAYDTADDEGGDGDGGDEGDAAPTSRVRAALPSSQKQAAGEDMLSEDGEENMEQEEGDEYDEDDYGQDEEDGNGDDDEEYAYDDYDDEEYYAEEPPELE